MASLSCWIIQLRGGESVAPNSDCVCAQRGVETDSRSNIITFQSAGTKSDGMNSISDPETFQEPPENDRAPDDSMESSGPIAIEGIGPISGSNSEAQAPKMENDVLIA